MSLQFRESFQLHAPIDRVWAYLADPRQVVTCLPGAELVSEENAVTYHGRVKVKVGPVTAAYDGTITVVERDELHHVVRMRGHGRETGGSGSASMTLTSTLVPLPGAMTQVEVAADIDIVGRIMQFGRGMIESVNKQLFKQFTTCLTATLERQPASAAQAVDTAADVPLAAERPNPTPRTLHLLPLIWQILLARLRLLFRANARG